MAVTNEQLLVQISLDTANASKSLDALTVDLVKLKTELKGVNESTKKTANILDSIGASALFLKAKFDVAKIAISAVVGAIKPLIGEFIEAEDGSKKLANMLQLFGDYTPEAAQGFKDWAGALQEATTIQDDMAIKLATNAKAMGLSNDQAKKMVETATDLAAVTGDSVEQSFQGLTMTLKGNARGLGEMGVLLGDLTEKELQAGKGIDRISQIFEGQGTAALNTFSGQIKYAANMFGELLEATGGVISELIDLPKLMSFITESFKSLTKWVNENKEEIIVWGQFFKATIDGAVSFGVGLLQTLQTALKGIATGFLKVSQAAGFLAEKFGLIKPETYEAMKDNADDMWESTKKSADSVKDSFSDAYSGAKVMNEEIKKSTPVIKAAGAAFKGMGFGAKEALKEVEGIIKELEKRILDSNKNIATIGATEAQTIEAKRVAAQGELDVIERKLKELDQLKGKQLELLNINRQLADNAAAKELITLQRKNADELIAKNQELYLSLNKDTMTQSEMIDAQTEQLQKQLDLKYETLALGTRGTEELEKQYDLLEQMAAQQKQKAGSDEYQALEKTGKDIGIGVSDALKNGIGGLMGGFASMMSGVMAAIDAVAGVVNTILDFIPKILDTVSGILNKITDLPNVILTAVQNLGKAILDFVGKFIPNLLKSIPAIVNELIKTLFIELPKVFIEMVKSLPGIMKDVLKQLTENIDELVSALVAAMPEISLALVETFIKNGPRISMEIMKTISIELPKAIIKGMVDGAKRLLNMFKNIFGKGQKIQIDAKQVMSVVKDLGKKLSGEAGKLFAIVDMEAAQKTMEKTAAIETAVSDGINKIKAVWQQLIDGLLTVWRWVYDNIIKPIFDGLRNIWLWVYNNVIMLFINGLTAVWQWINIAVIQPLLTGIQTAFQWVVDNILVPLATFVSTAFQWVVDKILIPLSTFVSSAFQWVIDNVIRPLSSIGESSFSWVYKNIVEPLKKIGAIFESFKLPSFKWPELPKFTWPEIPTPSWIKDLQSATGGGGGGGGGVGGAVKKVGKALGFAKGGIVPLYAANGVMVPRGTDTVPAMLTPGEFVVNRGAVNSLGMGAMNSINNGVAPSQNTTINIDLKIDTSEPVTEDYVRNRLMPRLKDELRRASLDGQFILSAKGVR